MSFPNIPNITPTISITTAQTIPLLLSSIALEELALAHIMNAEAEKLQFVLGTLPTGTALSPAVVSLAELFAVDSSVQRTLRDVIKKEMLLEFKFENVLDLIATLPPVISTFLFVSNREDNTIAIFDISNPLSPLLVRKFGTGDFPGSLNGPTGLAITGNTLYVSNQFDSNVAIFDISIPIDPVHVGQVSTGLSDPTGFAITGNTLYIANRGDDRGVAIYDISFPPTPIFVSKFTEVEFPGALNSPTGLAITGNTLYVSNQLDDIVAIFDILLPTNPVHVDNFGTDDLSGPTGLVISGTTLSVANFNDSTIEVYDITFPTGPVRVADFGADDLSGPQGLVFLPIGPVTPPLLYVANLNNSTVEVYDINNFPIDPIRVADFGAGVLNGPFGLAIYPTGPV
ncbi:LVIVD repeat-containing protein [Peribacillus butanolivorans]|uniref:LVIVD repeat-containing protein n=1 Tax=Peribacillus butanolivorans TaxID=421767 RepID=UPI0036DDDBFF